VTDVSVVIVSFNTRDLLARTIAAVLQEPGLGIDVHVVDNASADGSAEMVRTRFPTVAVTANDDNRYYSAGNNQALRKARGRYALVLNPDAEPTPGTLHAMVAYLDAHPEVGALTPRLCFRDGRVQRTCSRLRTFRHLLLEHTFLSLLFPRSLRELLRDFWYAAWDRATEQDVSVLPGSCIMVRREVLDTVGTFDERLRMYFSDDDWCERIARAGFRLVYAPIGVVMHPEGASTSQRPWAARRLYFQDMVRYTATRFGTPAAVLVWLLTRPTLLALAVSGMRHKR
jgi:hypothetical protein